MKDLSDRLFQNRVRRLDAYDFRHLKYMKLTPVAATLRTPGFHRAPQPATPGLFHSCLQAIIHIPAILTIRDLTCEFRIVKPESATAQRQVFCYIGSEPSSSDVPRVTQNVPNV